MKNSWGKRLAISFTTICLCLCAHSLMPADAQTNMPRLPQGITKFLDTPFSDLAKTPCTQQLKAQFNQQQVPLDCQIGTMVSADKLITLGNLASLGITNTSLQEIARVNKVDLTKVGADQLQKFYEQFTPATLLGKNFNSFFQNQPLANLPLVQKALTQSIASQSSLGNLAPLQSLNNLIRKSGGAGDLQLGSLLKSQASQQIANLPLNKAVAAIPSFGDFSLGNLSTKILKENNVVTAVPGLEKFPLNVAPNITTTTLNAFKAVGLNNNSMYQLPKKITYPAGIQFGKFDIPLGKDERDLGRQISGGMPGNNSFRKQNCRGTCKFVEISAPNTNYHGATWVDAENFVPDGFGIPCAVPGVCRGPAGNHPVGDSFRLLLTNINASKGTAQMAVSFRKCDDFKINCTPYVFPSPSGFPIGTIKEGQSLPFIVPQNYGDK
jgi:hypothetical protein